MLKSPFHPGHFLRQLVTEHDISQTKLGHHLGIQIGVINQICNEKHGIAAAMAIKLSMALGTSSEFWLNLQMAYDLGQQSRPSRNIRPLIKVA